MQSGLRNTKKWTLKLEAAELNIDPFIGWTGSKGEQQSHLFSFDTKEQAENFAKKKNLDYKAIDPQKKKVEPKSYIDNFKPC